MKYHNVRTTCVYCGVGCGMHLEVLDGDVVGVLPAKAHPVSEGHLCIKGWNAHAFVHHADRLTRPLIRRNGRLASATWDEALGLVSERLGTVKSEFGSDAIGVLSSAKCTNEENYLLQKFARATLGTNNIDHCARL
jgi:predicted molibdopterin-dependent oxidoreductase YjgC